ncbi:MAG TPA: hypothetical protein DCQ98_08690 [Planctomycetaceae bacterium]|nr:hypothetical protein [Planctomycetaceae bacterium]HRF02815.1 hypothetical protein [Pirellulaceae bacterium]
MTTDDRPIDPPDDAAETAVDAEHDDLVAYLDGELSTEDTARIDRRLTEEPRLRQRLATLQQSWDLLEALPRSSVAESFTRSTLEMVALSAQHELAQARPTGRRSRRGGWLLIGSLAVAASFAGFLAVRYRLDQSNRKLIDDLPVIERVDLYRNVGDIEFLVRLSEEGLFDAPTADGE